MKRFLPCLLVLTFPSLLFAQPKQSKPLIWGADLDGGVPYVFKDDDGKTVGFEVDIAEALSKELGRPILFKQYAFDSLLSGVERGDFDLAMNGLEITPENLERARFSRPYYIYQLQLVARQNEDRFKTFEELKQKKLTVGTLGASAADRLLKDEDIPHRIYDEQEGPYKDLQQNGGIDAVLLDVPVALYYAVPAVPMGRKITGLKFVDRPFAEGFYGIAVKKDNPELAKELDAALDRMLESGELKRILTKWELWSPEQYRLYTTPKSEVGVTRSLSFWYCLTELSKGAAMTVFLTFTSMLLAVGLGLLVALVRLYGPPPFNWLAVLYVEFFRGIPVLLLLYFLYFGLASLIPGLKLGAIEAAILGFGLNYAAYEAEIYRAGITSIPKGQWEAGAALGMSGAMTFRRIILPQAIRVILPPMTNDLVALFKDTSVVSIIAVMELSKQYQILTKSGADYLTIGLLTAGLYLIMSVPLSYLSRTLEKRWGSKG